MINLLDFELNRLEEILVSEGFPKFRAKQIYSWTWKGASFDEMSNVPKSLKSSLMEKYSINLPKVIKEQVSKNDGTRKYLFQLEDGNAVESVFMKYKYGNSICVSSQAGCRMGCKFCASTIGGLERNLTPGEIAGQILACEKASGEKISHVVVMGTGEPFDNYDNLSAFLKIINSKDGLNIGMRNITVSTCGLIPGIKRFAEDFPQVNLAISLHQVNNEERSALMPINRKYPIEDLFSSLKEYVEKTSRRVTFEYTLVKNQNDDREHALELAKLLKGMLCHVNLIPLNEVKETGLKTTDRKTAIEFQKTLEEKGIPATIRRELGDDIDAACGQLRLKK